MMMENSQKTNFAILIVSTFIVTSSMTMIMPFLSLYISTFGHFSDNYVQKWTGLIFGATFISAFLMSPVWGRIADKYGYKPIMIINCIGMALSIFFMSYVHSVEQFFILRLLMGIVAGFIPTSTAFVSKNVNKKVAGKTLGTLQIGIVGGSLFGPIIGGILADVFGFHFTFLLTSIMIALVSVIVILGIKEQKYSDDRVKSEMTSKEIFAFVFRKKAIVSIMIVTMLIQIGNFSIQPLLSLYVEKLAHTDYDQVILFAGIAFSVAGIGNILFARYWGGLADQMGYEKILAVLFIVSVFMIIPQAFVTTLWQFILLRFFFGIFSGGFIPITVAMVRQEAPLEIQGQVMGYNQSFMHLGNIIGPISGGMLSGLMSIHSVFFMTGLLFVIAAMVTLTLRRNTTE